MGNIYIYIIYIVYTYIYLLKSRNLQLMDSFSLFEIWRRYDIRTRCDNPAEYPASPNTEFDIRPNTGHKKAGYPVNFLFISGCLKFQISRRKFSFSSNSSHLFLQCLRHGLRLKSSTSFGMVLILDIRVRIFLNFQRTRWCNCSTHTTYIRTDIQYPSRLSLYVPILSPVYLIIYCMSSK